MRKSVTSKARPRAPRLLLMAVLAGGTLSGCALFGAKDESTVAQGHYYASGNAYYDEFFVDLYMLQVGMAEAPRTPEVERQRLVQLLQLEPQATPAMIEQRLHEEALSLSRAGVHLRLDQSSLAGGPEAAFTQVRSNARPKENPAATLLATVETSSTNLLRFQLTMKQKEAALGRLELMTIRLDAGVDRTFAQAPVGKPTEVKKNLADAHKLIPLMRARAEAVRDSTEQLLNALVHGIDTDDGSIGPPLDAEHTQTSATPETSPPNAGKKATKPHPKGKPGTTSVAPARPKPVPAPRDDDAPAKPRAPASKPAAPPRDFEP
ncbi:MAG TPA: hypothetical protein VER11_35840 [Polyangiaceae bacterium]|nr:hypothetical protein [Polyangiaceae bacterium]